MFHIIRVKNVKTKTTYFIFHVFTKVDMHFVSKTDFSKMISKSPQLPFLRKYKLFQDYHPQKCIYTKKTNFICHIFSKYAFGCQKLTSKNDTQKFITPFPEKIHTFQDYYPQKLFFYTKIQVLLVIFLLDSKYQHGCQNLLFKNDIWMSITPFPKKIQSFLRQRF